MERKVLVVASKYWVATSGGNWSATSSWSDSSGGASGASVPTVGDDVIFDANSITTGSSTISVDSDNLCKSLDMSGVLNSPTLNFDANDNLVIVGGAVTIPSSVNVTASSGSFNGPVFRGCTIDIQTSIPKPVFNTENSYLLSDLSMSGDVLISNITLFCKNNDLTFGDDATLTIAGGGDISASNLITFNGTSFDVTDTGAERTFNNITFAPVSGLSFTYSLGSTNTFSNVSVSHATSNDVSLNGTSYIYNFDIDLSNAAADVDLANDMNIGNLSYSGVGATNDLTIGTNVSIDNLDLTEVTVAFYELDIGELVLGAGVILNIEPTGVLRVRDLVNNAPPNDRPIIQSSDASSGRAILEKLKGAVELKNFEFHDIELAGNCIWYDGGGNTEDDLYGLTNTSKPTSLEDPSAFIKVFDRVGSYLGDLEVTNDFSITEEINNFVSETSIEVATSPVTEHINGKINNFNCIQLWVRTKKYPDGYLKMIGYIDGYEIDYDNEKAIFSARGYGNFLGETIFKENEGSDYSYTTNGIGVIFIQPGYKAIEKYTSGSGVSTLTRVDFKARAVTPASIGSSIDVELYDNLADAQSGTSPIATTIAYPPSITYQWVTARFSETLNISESTDYYVKFSSTTDGVFDLVIDPTPASAGDLLWDTPGQSWITTNDTLLMETFQIGGDTTVNYSDQDLQDILQNALDSSTQQGGKITYSTYTIPPDTS